MEEVGVGENSEPAVSDQRRRRPDESHLAGANIVLVLPDVNTIGAFRFISIVFSDWVQQADSSDRYSCLWRGAESPKGAARWAEAAWAT